MSASYGSSPMERRDDSRAGAEDRTSGREVRRDRGSVVAAEKERFGGVKIGSAFFGWLTATGVGVLLTAIVTAAGTVVAVAKNADVSTATAQVTENPQTVGLVGAVALLVVLFVAYFCGGYVAGRMARFDGARQGLAVWLWALVIAVVAAIVGAIGGSKYNVLARLDSFPRIPVDEGSLTKAGVVALIVVVLASLVGAILGGLAGMRFHRKVDSAGLGG